MSVQREELLVWSIDRIGEHKLSTPHVFIVWVDDEDTGSAQHSELSFYFFEGDCSVDTIPRVKVKDRRIIPRLNVDDSLRQGIVCVSTIRVIYSELYDLLWSRVLLAVLIPHSSKGSDVEVRELFCA